MKGLSFGWKLQCYLGQSMTCYGHTPKLHVVTIK